MAEARGTVLVVDDEPAFVDALSVALQREGYEVVTAHDGLEAMARFEDAHPDAVLLDLMLPRLPGVDVCRRMRGRRDVAIVIVTARSSEVDRRVGLEAGADDVVTKPYRLRELLERLEAARRAHSSAA